MYICIYVCPCTYIDTCTYSIYIRSFLRLKTSQDLQMTRQRCAKRARRSWDDPALQRLVAQLQAASLPLVIVQLAILASLCGTSLEQVTAAEFFAGTMAVSHAIRRLGFRCSLSDASGRLISETTTIVSQSIALYYIVL